MAYMLINGVKPLKLVIVLCGALLVSTGAVWISRAQPPTASTANTVVTVESLKPPTVNVTPGLPTRSIVDWPSAQASVMWDLASPTQLPDGFSLMQVEKYEFGAPIGVSFISTFKRMSDDAVFMIEQSKPMERVEYQVERGKIIRETEVNGIRFVAYDAGNRAYSPINIVWSDGERIYKAWGNLEVDELIGIVATVRP